MPKIRFNIKNCKYAVPVDGSYEASQIKSIGGANQLTLETTYSEQKEYADGQPMFILASDQGLTGTLSMKYLEDSYEIDMGRKMRIQGGLADIEQLSAIEHAIYFEIEEQDTTDKRTTVKAWLFNVTSGKPSETFTQTTENKTVNNYDIPINVLGEYLRAENGEDLYVDENGNTLRVWRLVSTPEEPDFATFGNSVPIPKVKS